MTNSSVTLCHHWSEQTGATATGFGVLTTRMPACPWCVIDQLHAAVKTAQELAARRLMEIERLKKREKDLMDVIDSRDRALGFVPLDEVHASRTGEAIVTNEQLIAIEMKPLEGCAAVLVSFNRPFTHVEMNAMHRALNEHLIPHDNEPCEQPWGSSRKVCTAEQGHTYSQYPDARRCIFCGSPGPDVPQGASRDASPGPNAWADAKGGLPDNTL